MKTRCILVSLLVVALIVTGCATSKAPPKAEAPAGYKSIRMVGSGVGSSASTAVIALSAILNKYYPEIEWSTASGATGTSAVYLTKGTSVLAQSGPPSYIDAYGFDKVPESRLRSIAALTPPQQLLWQIPEDKPWKDITEVPKGLAISPGSPGGSMIVAAEAWLKLAGLSKSDFRWVPMGTGERSDAWRTGKLDVSFAGIAGMAPFLMDMYNSPRKFKAMGLSPEQVASAKAEQTFDRLGCLPPAMTNVAELVPEMFKYDVMAPQMPMLLCSRDDFPEDIAYRMAKIIDERNAELSQVFPPMKYATPQWHIKTAAPPAALHPGVAKYYKEKGHLK